MVINNTGSRALKPDWNIYKERTTGFSKIKDVQTGEIRTFEEFEINPKESFVFELLK